MTDGRREKILILVICAVACVRIFVMCAAFPFFSNVDEIAHLDLVIKYANGDVPRGIENYSEETADLIAEYQSPEFVIDSPRGLYPPPLWEMPGEKAESQKEGRKDLLLGLPNHESLQPPLYYTAAALWYNLGKTIGIGGLGLLYWLRFLNVPIYGLLVWLAYLFAANIYPDRRFLRFTAPALVAFFPQDMFYSISNDTLAALLAGASLYCILRICVSGKSSYSLYVWAGGFAALAFLDKISNFMVYLALAAGTVWLISVRKRRKLELLKLAAGAAAAIIPTAILLIRNKLAMGDLFGTKEKIEMHGWVLKPFSEVWNHPVFGIQGFSYFIKNLMSTFWRGEFYWHGKSLSWSVMDKLYVITTIVFILAAIIYLVAARKRLSGGEKFADWLSLSVLMSGIGFLLIFSISYDFGDFLYPSRAMPYVVSGRLIMAALIPVVILYLNGLHVILEKMRAVRYETAAVVFLIALFTFSEVAMTLSPVLSLYNWFHLL